MCHQLQKSHKIQKIKKTYKNQNSMQRPSQIHPTFIQNPCKTIKNQPNTIPTTSKSIKINPRSSKNHSKPPQTHPKNHQHKHMLHPISIQSIHPHHDIYHLILCASVRRKRASVRRMSILMEETYSHKDVYAYHTKHTYNNIYIYIYKYIYIYISTSLSSPCDPP